MCFLSLIIDATFHTAKIGVLHPHVDLDSACNLRRQAKGEMFITLFNLYSSSLTLSCRMLMCNTMFIYFLDIFLIQ